MRSRRCSGYGWPSGDTRGSGRRVTCKAPLAHVEGGSGRPEASPTAILQDTHSVEGKFRELPLYAVIRSSHCRQRGPLHLATAVHIVDLLSAVVVLAFAAIELIPLSIIITSTVQQIIAIPTVDDVLAPDSLQLVVAVTAVDDVLAPGAIYFQIVARPAVDYVIAITAVQGQVVARPAVDYVAAFPCEELVFSAKTADLVIAVQAVQHVVAGGAREQAAVGASGNVIGEPTLLVSRPLDRLCPLASGFFGVCCFG